MTEDPGNQPSIADASQPTTQPPGQPYGPPAAPYAPAAYPPPEKGSSTLKIVLIVVGIVVGLGVVAAGVVGYGVYRIMKSSTVTSSSQPVTEAELGVPIYPGAEQGKSVHMNVLGLRMLTAKFLTVDSVEQVVAFYRNDLGPATRIAAVNHGESLKLDKGAGESIVVAITQTPSIAGGKTQIAIVHTAKAAAPQ